MNQAQLNAARRRSAAAERRQERQAASDRRRVARALSAAIGKVAGRTSTVHRARVKRGAATRAAGSFTRRGKSPSVIHKKARGGPFADPYAELKAIATFTNMLGLNSRERAEEFAQDARRHPRARADGVTRHSILAFSPGLQVTMEQVERVVRAWLKRIGADGNNFCAHVHQEVRGGAHALHVHILWSRSRPDGRLVSLSNDYYAHREAAHCVAEAILGAREIDRLGGAERPAAATDVAARAAQRARRLGGPAAWVDARQVHEALARARTPAELQQLLARGGIELQVSRRPDGTPRGLLMRRAGSHEWLSASAIARDLSLPRVQAALTENFARSAHMAQRSAAHQDHNFTPADRPRGG